VAFSSKNGITSTRQECSAPVGLPGFGTGLAVGLAFAVYIAAGKYFRASRQVWNASPSCRRWLRHCVRRALSRALCTAGKSSPIRVAMIAITTKSSTSVNARRLNARGELQQARGTLRETLGGRSDIESFLARCKDAGPVATLVVATAAESRKPCLGHPRRYATMMWI